MSTHRGARPNASDCQAETATGRPCRATALPGGAYCFSHEPELEASRQEARRRGAVNGNKLRAIRGQRARLDTPVALVRFTAGVVHDVLDGTVTPDVGRVVLYGLSIQRQLVESGDVEERLRVLEDRALGPHKRGARWGT